MVISTPQKRLGSALKGKIKQNKTKNKQWLRQDGGIFIFTKV